MSKTLNDGMNSDCGDADLELGYFPHLKHQTMRPLRLMLIILFATFISTGLFAQAAYESAMKQLAESVHSSLSGTENKTVLVSFFRRTEGKGCNVDETITGDFEVAFGSLPRTYKVLNRAVLNEYAKEHKLSMEGQMDEEQKMKEAGKLLKADIMVFGSYRFIGNNLVLRVHADDIQTSEQLTIVSVTCMPTKLLKKACEEASTVPASRNEPSPTGAPGTRSESAQATNTSGSPTTVPCITQTGNYCFQNNSRMTIRFGIGSTPTSRDWEFVTSRPGKTECLLDRPARSYSYSFIEERSEASPGFKKPLGSGNVKVEPCQTGTYTYP